MNRVTNPVLRRLREVAALPDLPGERYTLNELLGEGGMGAVYSGYDETLDREVAIKVARSRMDGALADRLRAEARVLARLEHPGIVPVHDAGVLDDGRVFYVMKRVRGVTLTTWLPQVPELERRLNLLERVCDTLAFAHQRSVVHRDLKPDNIMVGDFGEVLVLDWGVAKLMSQPESFNGHQHGAGEQAGQTLAGTVLGTPGFMAPEQGRAEQVDPRADVYALGGLLYQMMFDQPPPGASGASGELHKRRDLPKRLRAICRMALAPAPAERYIDATALAADIARFRAGRSVHAYRETPIDRLERAFTLYRTPILLVLAYLLMRTLFALISR